MAIVPNVTYNEQPGLYDLIIKSGYTIRHYSVGCVADNPTAVQAIIDNYNAVSFLQTEAITTIETTLQEKLAAGLVIGSNTIAIDAVTQSEINQLCNLAHVTIAGLTTIAWPPGRYWPVISGSPIPLTTPQDVITIGSLAAHYVWSLKNYAQTIGAEIMAATTSAEISTILTNASWPTS